MEYLQHLYIVFMLFIMAIAIYSFRCYVSNHNTVNLHGYFTSNTK